MKALLTLTSLLACIAATAQTDSLWMSNGDVLVGELKEMVRGVATMETDYSDSDLKLDWGNVRRVRTRSRYLVNFQKADQVTARLHSPDTASLWVITDADTLRSSLDRVVFLKAVKDDFWSRATLGFDLGYNYTKASNLQQFSLRAFLGYQTDRWMGTANFDRVNSIQDGVDDIQRTSWNVGGRWALPKRFYAGLDASFLSNTEQQLDLRSSIQPTVGNYVLRNNELYMLVNAGAAFTEEEFRTEDPDRSSVEGLMGLELSLFDVGDISLFISSKAFPSFTDAGRWRMDHRFDVKYDLPLDIYIRAGFTLNYDNRPVAGASESDYVFQTAVGWSL